MAEITWLIAWNNKVKDYQFRSIISSLVNQWVIEWLEVTAWQVATWKAVIEVTRTNWQVFLVDFHNTTNKVVTLWNNKKIFIAIDQNKIDDWDSFNLNTDWTDIAIIEVADSYPITWAFIKLAETDWWWVITDLRELLTIKKDVEQRNTYSASNTWNDSYSVNIPWIISYEDWNEYKIKVDVANTGACTFEINWLWAIAVKKQQWTSDLSSWDWVVNWIATLVYNSTWPVWQFTSQVAIAPTIDIVSLTEKTIPVDADDFIMYDSVWLNNKKTWYDNLKSNIIDWLFNSKDMVVFQRFTTDPSSTITYGHNLWKIPQIIQVQTAAVSWMSNGAWINNWSNTNKCMFVKMWGNDGFITTSFAIVSHSNTNDGQLWFINNVTSTTFDITWTYESTPPAFFIGLFFLLIW